MSNFIYSQAKTQMMSGNATFNLASGNVYVALANSTYVPNANTDQFFSSANSGLVTTPVKLTSVTVANAMLTAANTTFSAVSAANGTVTRAIIYISNGASWNSSNTTAPLIASIDSATGLPVTPNGGDINLAWQTSSPGILTL